jgi:dolichol-phosphate mannosyltransferase
MAGNDVAIVVPVFREADNVASIIGELHHHLSGYDWEVVFVDDDSDDGTADVVRSYARNDERVRLVLRVNERGLATAGTAGMLTTKSRCIVLMDGDGQHDPRYIPDLIEPITREEADVVSAARSLDQLDEAAFNLRRRHLSNLANRIAGHFLRRPVCDPMTGFFAISAEAFNRSVRRLSAGGFKLLLDILISNPALRHREIPFEFRNRRAGESKLDLANAWQLVCFLISKALGGLLPPAFISFGLVGASGVFVHFAVLYTAIWSGLPFATAQLIAALVASAWNFGLNNSLTFRDRQLARWGILAGLAKYIAISSVGIAANVAVASATFNIFRGLVALSALAGIAVDAVWKYFMSNLLVWRQPNRTQMKTARRRGQSEKEAAVCASPLT